MDSPVTIGIVGDAVAWEKDGWQVVGSNRMRKALPACHRVPTHNIPVVLNSLVIIAFWGPFCH